MHTAVVFEEVTRTKSYSKITVSYIIVQIPVNFAMCPYNLSRQFVRSNLAWRFIASEEKQNLIISTAIITESLTSEESSGEHIIHVLQHL